MVAAAGVLIAAAAALVLTALNDTIVYFRSPSDLAAAPPRPDERIRIGGLVKEGSVRLPAGGGVQFVVTDLAADTAVRFAGEPPALFREGQGVVAQGVLGPGGVFIADEVLAKHDETYMPPEAVKALKDAGQWRDGAPAAPAMGGRGLDR